jgi:hypothetical protein
MTGVSVQGYAGIRNHHPETVSRSVGTHKRNGRQVGMKESNFVPARCRGEVTVNLNTVEALRERHLLALRITIDLCDSCAAVRQHGHPGYQRVLRIRTEFVISRF